MEILVLVEKEHLRLGYKFFLEQEGYSVDIDVEKKEYDLIITHGVAPSVTIRYKHLISIVNRADKKDKINNNVLLFENITSEQLLKQIKKIKA